MTSITVIISIVILLAGLVCYAFIAQTMRQKKEQRTRLTAALKSRLRSFKFLINGFPQGFLPKDLVLVIYRSLIDICEQLTKLEPREPSHLQDLEVATLQLQEAQRATRPEEPPKLESTQQIGEVKMCLEELFKFLFVLEKRAKLSNQQAEHHRNQIKQLAVQVTVDNYSLLGHEAKQKDKHKLAAHYLNLAVKLMERDGKRGQFDDRLAEMREELQELYALLADSEETSPTSAAEQAEQDHISEEWDKFGSDNNTWKKKHVYD